jgi:hypothetical protein
MLVTSGAAHRQHQRQAARRTSWPPGSGSPAGRILIARGRPSRMPLCKKAARVTAVSPGPAGELAQQHTGMPAASLCSARPHAQGGGRYGPRTWRLRAAAS